MWDFIFDVVGFGLKLLMILGLVLVIVATCAGIAKMTKIHNEVKWDHENLKFTDLKQQRKACLKRMNKKLKAADPEQRLKQKEIALGVASEEDKAQEAENKRKKSKRYRKEHQKEKRQSRETWLQELQQKREAGEFCPRNLFVIDFNGSTKGTEVKALRQKIDAILSVANEQDEVIVNLKSPGGLVNTYGLGASQIQRLRDHGVTVTVTVDEVAASGGYLMACVANKIVAAPFAYIGSIGVIAGIPNFRRVLNKYNVDYEQITAGKYKRTLSVLGLNTEEGRQKFKEELDAVHKRFQEQVQRFRPQLDMAKVATGEHWLAADALELGLIDEIGTSEEYIQKRLDVTENSALKLKWQKPKNKKNGLLQLLPFFSRLFGSKADSAEVVEDESESTTGTHASTVMTAAAAMQAMQPYDAETLLQNAQEQLQSIEQSSFFNMR